MSNDIPAFPITAGNQVYNQGLYLRDYMAAKAMQGELAAQDFVNIGWPDELAERAYLLADAMLKAREE